LSTSGARFPPISASVAIDTSLPRIATAAPMTVARTIIAKATLRP
jgi:hypothetical protein